MSNWADELRALLVESEDTMWAALDINIRALVSVGERQLEHALNTVECLVEANAALREQLCEFKSARRDSMIGRKEPGIEISTAPKAGLSAGEALSPLGNAAANFQEPKK